MPRDVSAGSPKAAQHGQSAAWAVPEAAPLAPTLATLTLALLESDLSKPNPNPNQAGAIVHQLEALLDDEE